MRSTLSFVGLFILIGATAGCATFRGASARHQYIESQSRDYVYAKPAGEVWPAARAMLFEKGYEVKNTGEGGTLTAESEWKYDGKNRSRYLIQVNPVDEGHCKVVFTKLEGDRKSTSTDSTRDIGTEWELIQRVEPERAAEIKAEAEKRADAAKAAS
jgi:hypothetical protein